MYRIRIFDMRKIIVLFLPMMFLLSCGIDVPELNVSLRPPMGLSVKYITNSVRIEFWGFNDEDYFSGYVVFVSDRYDEIVDPVKSISEKPKIPDLNTRQLPTFSVLPESRPKLYIFEIPLDAIDDRGSYAFLGRIECYVAVAAYSVSKKIFSPLSNITNVVLTN